MGLNMRNLNKTMAAKVHPGCEPTESAEAENFTIELFLFTHTAGGVVVTTDKDGRFMFFSSHDTADAALEHYSLLANKVEDDGGF